MRSLTNRARVFCDVLSGCGIPVAASLKNDVLGKEIKDLLNFLRVLDNPLNDIPFAGALLGWFGGLDARELAVVAEKQIPIILSNARRNTARNSRTVCRTSWRASTSCG